MDNNEILQVIKDYYAKKLDGARQMADNGGLLSGNAVNLLKKELEQLDRVVDEGYEDLDELRGVEDEHSPYSARNQVKQILEDAGLDIAEDSDEFEVFKHLNKFGARNFLRDWIAYNEQASNFSLLSENAANNQSPQIKRNKIKHTLETIMEGYLKELKPTISPRSYMDQADCLNYLIDYLGEVVPRIRTVC